jgi:hypothetical protein
MASAKILLACNKSRLVCGQGPEMNSTLKSLTKKIGQLQQWTGEKLGGTQKTDTSEEFKRLDTEVVGRLDSAGRLHKVLGKIVKHLCNYSALIHQLLRRKLR